MALPSYVQAKLDKYVPAHALPALVAAVERFGEECREEGPADVDYGDVVYPPPKIVKRYRLVEVAD